MHRLMTSLVIVICQSLRWTVKRFFFLKKFQNFREKLKKGEKMASVVKVEGYEEYKKFTEENKGHQQPIFVLFTGSVDPETGKSWCPDCVKADPVIEKCFGSRRRPETSTLLVVHVGQRAAWKDPNSPFRTDAGLRLKGVPTLVRMGGPEVLVEGQCADENMVNMLMGEEDD